MSDARDKRKRLIGLYLFLFQVQGDQFTPTCSQIDRVNSLSSTGFGNLLQVQDGPRADLY